MSNTTAQAAARQAAVSQSVQNASGLAVFFVALGAFVSALAQSLLVPVLPTLPAALHTSMLTVQWAITSTVLAGAVVVPILGRLGDMFGKRRMLLVSLTAMVVGALIAALAQDVVWLIVGRVIQGVSAGSLPLGISLVATTVPKHKQASSVALISGMLGVGGALGLPLAGLVAQVANYHALFWIASGAAAVAFAGVLFGVPESPHRTAGRLDLAGSFLLAVALLALLVPLSEAGVWGWTNPLTIGLLVCAAVLFVVFGHVERHAEQPLIDLTTLRLRPVLLADLASVFIGFSMFGSILGTSSYVQAPTQTGYGFGASVAVAGLTMLPAGLAMLVASPIASVLIKRVGSRLTLTVGSVLVAIGWVMRIVLISGLGWVTIGTAVIGLGVGFCFAALPAIINASAPVLQNAAANSLNALFRSLGITLVSALCGTILASLVMTVGPVSVPTLAAYRWIFAICGLGALAAAGMALAIRPINRAGAA